MLSVNIGEQIRKLQYHREKKSHLNLHEIKGRIAQRHTSERSIVQKSGKKISQAIPLLACLICKSNQPHNFPEL